MRQTVTTAIQICAAVSPAALRKRAGPTPQTSAVRIAATKMPVPVASGWKLQTAA